MEFFSPPTTPRKLPCSKTPLGLSLRSSVNKCSSSHSRVIKNELNKSPTMRKMDQSNDRFIPNRSGIDFDFCNNMLTVSGNEENSQVAVPQTPQDKRRTEVLQAANQTPGRRLIDCFDRKTPMKQAASPIEQLKRPSTAQKRKSTSRYLPSGPSKILDAPGLVDDYYLNLLSWGHQNVVAIALGPSVYLWNANTCSVAQLCRLDDEDYVTSVQWSSRDDTIAVGTFSQDVQIYDTTTSVKLRSLPGHSARVSSLSWNQALLSSGGRDSIICNHDTRIQHALCSVYSGHSQEICGLAWSPDGAYLASGGNENKLCVWDATMSSSASTTPRYEFLQHNAAVKALQWCPFQRNVLASGGGTADKTIKLWNINMGTMLSSMNTGSQVCALQWSESNRELVSSHGFSDFEICLWKYTKQQCLTKVRDFKGHTARVLHLAKSPDDSRVLSASADETLRFWDILDGSGQNSGRGDVSPVMLSGSMGLR